MALIVHKYGGTSMGSTERIKNVARRVAKWHDAGHQVVVVPSAMSGETNRLIALAKEIQNPPDPRELDMIASTGEQVSVGLLSMALQAIGKDAISYTGWQVAIKTDSAFTKARIQSIEDGRVREDLEKGRIVIITGFQGVDENDNIATLGRGGSDTSAVAIAAALKADECLIYTDVDGVYTTDPRVVSEARRLKAITFEEMLELASLGSKVLQTRSVEFAGNYRVPTRVLSSLTDPLMDLEEEANSGTLISFEEDQNMEQAVISGIAFNRDEAKITVLGVPDRPGVAFHILGPIAEANIEVDMIIQNQAVDRLHLHGVAQRLPESAGRAAQREGRDRPPHPGRRRQGVEDFRGGRGHAFARGRGIEDVRDAGCRRHQHHDDLHLRDQDFRPDRREIHGAGRACTAQSVRVGKRVNISKKTAVITLTKAVSVFNIAVALTQ
jgi:aspartate kinase